MKIKTAEYVGSFVDPKSFPRDLGPEFVFLGRSNVGKSSLINTLIGRKDLARTSNAPGKTRTVNFYHINEKFCFVDVPGYGYAQVSKVERQEFRGMISGYLDKRKSLKGVVQLLDIRHPPSAEDRETSAALGESAKPVCLVFNKADKIKRHQVDRQIAAHLGDLPTDTGWGVVAFSAETHSGKGMLWSWIEAQMSDS